MKKKEALFYLIKSLSGSEKRYFKVYCGQTGKEGKYLKVFDAIEKMEEYDEDRLRKKFAGEAFLNQFHVLKNYLNALILKSLRNYHAHLSKDAEVKDLLRNVEILFRRELYRHCEEELGKAQKVAKKYELNIALIEIHHWRRKLRQAVASQDFDSLLEHSLNQQEAIQLVQNYNEYLQLILNVSGLLSGKEIEPKYQKTLEDPANAHSLDALILHYNAMYIREIITGKSERAEQILYELLNKLEAYPHRIQETPMSYISTLNNFIAYMTFNKRFEEGLKLISRAQSLSKKWKVDKGAPVVIRQMLRTYMMELEIFRDQRDTETHAARIAELEAFVTKEEKNIPLEYQASFWFQFAYLHYLSGNLSPTLKWLNLLLNTRLKATRLDIQLHGRLLNLMVHFEQGNLFVLRYFVDSSRRFIRKNYPPDDFHEILLKFFAKISKSPISEYRGQFVELKSVLFPVEGEPLIKARSLDYVEYKEWIERMMDRVWI